LQVVNLTDALFEQRILKDNREAEKILSGVRRLNSLECTLLKVHCIAWSSSFHREADFLAVGGALGEITLWKFTQNQGLCYDGSWKPSQDGAGIVTHIAWSPWINDSSTGMAPMNKMVSILAASTVEGSVHLALVSTSASNESGSLEIQEQLTCKLFPESRIPTTKLAWKKRDHDFILAVSRNGSLSLSIHPFHALPRLSSTQVSCRHKSYSRPVGKSIVWSIQLTQN
jgi:hypothetical protein